MMLLKIILGIIAGWMLTVAIMRFVQIRMTKGENDLERLEAERKKHVVQTAKAHYRIMTGNGSKRRRYRPNVRW